MGLSSIEICAGGGGQALGLEAAGFDHVALVEIEQAACDTLKRNRPEWNVVRCDIHGWHAFSFEGGIDLVAGGVPCPPFSVAGKQLGEEDERDLFPEALRVVEECSPRAVMIENVRGLFAPKFDAYREAIVDRLEADGYRCWWRVVQASDFGVSQSRSRSVLVALREPWADAFRWPEPKETPQTVGVLLHDEMARDGWRGADAWAEGACSIAPTIVGGSRKHGGPDLGPTRAREAWRRLGVDGTGIADDPPTEDFTGMPRLTVPMVALVQGFPAEWRFSGRKTAAYRQVGNAFPPPVAETIGKAIKEALDG